MLAVLMRPKVNSVIYSSAMPFARLNEAFILRVQRRLKATSRQSFSRFLADSNFYLI